jgi:hypothetical protein
LDLEEQVETQIGGSTDFCDLIVLRKDAIKACTCCLHIIGRRVGAAGQQYLLESILPMKEGRPSLLDNVNERGDGKWRSAGHVVFNASCWL